MKSRKEIMDEVEKDDGIYIGIHDPIIKKYNRVFMWLLLDIRDILLDMRRAEGGTRTLP